jgi:LPXTG-site transpeptidase (sortase) family protein
VNADIITVGKNADGSMETPDINSHDTGWYKYGPTPGEIGPAIIVGHVDNLNGPSVFWRLGELKAGDKVEITRKDGKPVKFKVDSVQQFEQENFPAKKVYGNTDHAGLRLITCGGTFDSSTGRYTHNTVVFASVIK